MFGDIVRFELLHRIRQLNFLITAALMALLGGVIAWLAANSTTPGIETINQPYKLGFWYARMALAGAYIPLSIFSDIVRRDAATGMSDIVRATPARDGLILLARCAAGVAAVAVLFAMSSLGYEIGSRMPWINDKLVGPFALQPHVRAFAIIYLPVILFCGGIAALASSLSANRFAPFLLMIGLYIMYATSWIGAGRLSSMSTFSLLDPTAANAIIVVTRYWTNVEKAVQQIPFTDAVLINRSVYFAVTTMALAITALLAGRRDSPGLADAQQPWTQQPGVVPNATATSPLGDGAVAAMPAPELRREARAPRRPRPVLAPSAASWRDAFKMRFGFELQGLLSSWSVILLLGLPALIAIPVLLFDSAGEGDLPLLPVTASIVPKINGAGVIPLLLLGVLFAGEMVWRERQARMSEIIDATTTPSLVHLTAKLGALATLLALQIAVLMAIGITYQLTHGAPQIGIAEYLAELVVSTGIPILICGVMAMLVHALIPSRMLAHLVSIGLIGLITSLESLGVENRLYTFADTPNIQLSDMNGLGHYLKPVLWFLAYWCAVAVILLLLADLLRERGAGTPLMARVRAMRHMPRETRLIGTAALAATAGLGGFLFWNTHILNDYETTKKTERDQVAYEKQFAPLLGKPQPRVTALDLTLDLSPETRSFATGGQITLTNVSDAPITEFIIDGDLKRDRLVIPDAASIDVIFTGSCCETRLVQLKTPLQPGAKVIVTIDYGLDRRGFTNAGDSSGMRHNGTFLTSQEIAPEIGVKRRLFLSDEKRRLAYGLPPLVDEPGPGEQWRYRRNYISNESDFLDFAITISTSPDQIAIAPGYLKREWEEKGRRYFRYEMDKPIVGFWSVVSARYAVAKDKWNDVDLSVHYHPPHAANVPLMMEGMKLALDYNSKAFGPFQYRQMRIVEFPYGNFAQSFPNTVPFAEMAGFIGDPSVLARSEIGVIDITAHEVGHQWWAHQVISADVPGATFLSETLSEYSMLMVMERRFGKDTVRALIRRDMDRYLKSRGGGDRERPIARVRPDQPQIAYQKGGVAMYALREAAGEEAVNRGLARFIREYGGKSNPYPTSVDLLRVLRAECGPQFNELIADLFERIALWDLRATAATATKTPDGKWLVKLDVTARKLEADENGTEKENQLNQPIEVGLFRSDPRTPGLQRSNTIVVESRRIKTGEQSVEIISDEEPKFAAVNPFLTLVQRNGDARAVAVKK